MARRLLSNDGMNLDPTLVPVTDVMSRNPVKARSDATVEALAALMTEFHIGCVPIVDSAGHATGIVTKADLVECRGEPRATAREVMMPHAMSLDPSATVADAARLMSREGFHHLLVVDQERTLVGVVSTLDITRWIAERSPALE